MKKIIFAFICVLGISSCTDKILDLDPLAESTSSTFFANEAELELALTGVYSGLYMTGGYGMPLQMIMDFGGSDLGLLRSGGVFGFDEIGAGTHSASTGGIADLYRGLYRGIGRANNLLLNMDKAEGVSQQRLDEIRGQTLALRAYNYTYLVNFFGDVPYIDFVPGSAEESLLERTPASTVIDNILADFQTAADLLPEKFSVPGRVTKAVAMALRARAALYAGRYDVAAASAKAVIDMEDAAGLILYPDYEELFTPAAEGNAEGMLIMPFQEGFRTTQSPTALGSRNRGSYTTFAPSQFLVDSYEAIDGLPIDESPMYDPHHPFDNRDPRLKATLVVPQATWSGIIFESHPDSLTFRNADGSSAGANADCRTVKWPAAFCGYLFKKYTDEPRQLERNGNSELDIMILRYAEVLLTYAEAKIELNQIDDSVLEAINRVRARGYGEVPYTDVTTRDQAELRKLIRRERKIELAGEGTRYFDIRRWGIAEKVMPQLVIGRILDTSTATLVPDIDEDGFITYDNSTGQWDVNTDARFPNAQNRQFNASRDYLLPIPQSEIDTYTGLGARLEQNPGY
ncbi:MAG: RagB/SusD family nutrient uptake outer membrane protein [Lewinella sp.]|nr:RagB/SusD family nutrient uptake outer membrane protein [Lewinella sp.]